MCFRTSLHVVRDHLNYRKAAIVAGRKRHIITDIILQEPVEEAF